MPNPTNVDETLTLEEIASLPAIITTDVAARVMGVSPKTIRRACEEGAFRCFRAHFPSFPNDFDRESG